MQSLEFSCAVRLIYKSLGVKGLKHITTSVHTDARCYVRLSLR